MQFNSPKLMILTAMLAFGSADLAHAEPNGQDAPQELQRRKRRKKRRRRGRNRDDGGSKGNGNNNSSSNKKFTHVVTLGDSYSSGTGYHRNPKDYGDHGPIDHFWKKKLGATTCYRELRGTPGPRLAKQLGAKSLFGACRGGVIGTILNQFDSIAGQLPADGDKTLILMTIAGNDMLSKAGNDWPKTITKCILNTKKSKACGTNPDHEIKNWSQVQTRLTNIYKQVARRAPKAELRIMAYPRLMGPSADKCKGVNGINADEARWIDAQVDKLNGIIKKAVANTGNGHIKFVSLGNRFSGHGACQKKQKDRYVNDKIMGLVVDIVKKNGKYEKRYRPDNIGLGNYSSFHPSKAGYGAYFSALKGSI